MKWIGLCLWLCSGLAAAGCEGKATWRYQAQPSLLAHDSASALVVVLHDSGCASIAFPRQDRRAGMAETWIDPAELEALEALFAEAMPPPASTAEGDAPARVSSDPLLIGVRRLSAGKGQVRQTAWVASSARREQAEKQRPPRQRLQQAIQSLLDSTLPP